MKNFKRNFATKKKLTQNQSFHETLQAIQNKYRLVRFSLAAVMMALLFVAIFLLVMIGNMWNTHNDNRHADFELVASGRVTGVSVHSSQYVTIEFDHTTIVKWDSHLPALKNIRPNTLLTLGKCNDMPLCYYKMMTKEQMKETYLASSFCIIFCLGVFFLMASIIFLVLSYRLRCERIMEKAEVELAFHLTYLLSRLKS